MWQLPPDIRPEEILLYSRKSRKDDPLLTVSEVLAKHEEMLNEWIEKHFPGQTIPEENRLREVVSGETIDSRPMLQKVLRMVENPRYKAVLCVDCERLSRGDTMEIGYLTRIFRFSSTIVITLDDIYDLSEERDRSDFERRLKRGNEYLEYTKGIMRRGTENAVASGSFLGNKAPYGYQKYKIKEGKRTIHTLTPDPDTAPVVKMIFDLYAAGVSTHGIAKHLNDMGIPSPSGKKWVPASLPRIRGNVHYIGKIRWNYRKEVKFVEDGQIVKSRPLNKDGCSIYDGRHEPIIDEELFNLVNEMAAKNPPVKKSAPIVNPLSGIVYCRCGYCMTRRIYKKRYNGVLAERSAPRLLCPNQVECGTASCTMDEIMEVVVQTLRDTIADFDLKIDQEPADSATLHRQTIARLEKRLDDLNRQEVSQWEKYSLESMPKHIFDQLNAKVLQEKDDTLKALHDAKNIVHKKGDYVIKRATFQAALDALLDDTVDAKQQNMLLKQCIERIDYDRKRKIAKGTYRYGTVFPMELDIHLKV